MLESVCVTAKVWLRKVLCTVCVVVVLREENFRMVTRAG